MKWIHTQKGFKNLLSGIVLFNVLDIIFTLTMIELGFAVEANPFMIELLEISEILFGVVKISLVSLCVGLLWRLREHKIARTAGFFCFCTYALLMLYHIFGIIVSIDFALNDYRYY